MTNPPNAITPIARDEPFVMNRKADPIVDVVSKYFAIMADRFGRTLDPITVNGYVWALKRARLSVDEIEIALRYQFISAKFWPSPQDLITEALQYRQRDLERNPPRLAAGDGKLPFPFMKLDESTERSKVCPQCGTTFRQSRFDREWWASLDVGSRRMLKKAFPDGYCPDLCRQCAAKDPGDV